MARTIEQISADIIRYKDSRPELDKLNSKSATAIWRLWVFVMSVAIYTHEVLFDFFKEEVNELLDQRIQGTSEWYVQKALEYQEESELVVNEAGTQLIYNPVVLEKRLVTRAAYREEILDNSVILNLKLAKGDVDNLEKLDGVEAINVGRYFEKLKFAGTRIAISSLDPDILLPKVEVRHDGVYSQEEIKTRVIAAIKGFMVSLPFDGVFYKQRFVDAIQAVENVVDVSVDEIVIRSFENALVGKETLVDRKVVLASGYLKASDSQEETLDELITVIQDEELGVTHICSTVSVQGN